MRQRLSLAAAVLFAASAVCAQDAGYGPLTINLPRGADFYFAQNGEFARAEVRGDVIVVHLHNAAFQIGSNSSEIRLCLTEARAPEIKKDPQGFEASCLAGPMTGGRVPKSDTLFVYTGTSWSDGNNLLSADTNLAAAPQPRYRHGFQVNELEFESQADMNLSRFRGTLFGYIQVVKHPRRIAADIMPIELVFDGN
jgi:hypothetical protein